MLRSLIVVACCAFFAFASANGPWWTVQTVALRDFRQAQDMVAQLQQLGFPAYTEFAMNDGHQYTRVRVGCFTQRDGALALADELRNGVSNDAVVIEASAEFQRSGRLCTEYQTGFLKPGIWSYLGSNDNVAVFQVEVGTLTAYVAHDGIGWEVVQSFDPTFESAVVPRVPSNWRAQSSNVANQSQVMKHLEGSWWYACRGNLLGVFRDVAFVETSRAVVSCRYGGTG